MTDLWLHPALILLAGAALLPLVPERLRKGYMLLVPALTFARIYFMDHGVYGQVPFIAWELTFGRVDSLSQIFGYIMALMALIGTLYGLHVRRKGEFAAAWVYVGGSLGVIYAGDLLTLFVFWELMAFSSVFLIWYRGRKESLASGFRYLMVHAAGGVALLAGILLYAQGAESLAFSAFNVAQPGIGEWLILIGFILNAAVPPLHAWLPDGYAEATFSGSVFLCTFTTKTAVYALVRGFPGLEILIWLGVIMVLYGVTYAFLVNDARRLLSYHIVSQVGYMVTGVGIGTQLALNGVCAHAFAHILYKGLLFMGTGSVLYMTGQSKFTELGGLYKKMPWTFVFTLIGALAISAFPLFSGFVSKAMTVSAAFYQDLVWAAFLLMLASVGTFVSIGLKISYLVWFGKNRCSSETWEKAADPPWNMNAAMAIAAFLCIYIGVYTPYLYTMLPFDYVYNPYTSYHVSEVLQLLMFAMLAFFVLIKKLEPSPKVALDTDWFYRVGGRAFYRAADKGANSLNVWGDQLAMRRIPTSLGRFFTMPGGHLQWLLTRSLLQASGASPERIERERQAIAQRSREGSYPVGVSVLLAVVFLSFVSILFFLF